MTQQLMPRNTLDRKIEILIENLNQKKISNDLFLEMLRKESDLIDQLIIKYKAADIPPFAQVHECMIEALQMYQESLVTLGEEGNIPKSLELAKEADKKLIEVEQITQRVNLEYPNRGIQG